MSYFYNFNGCSYRHTNGTFCLVVGDEDPLEQPPPRDTIMRDRGNAGSAAYYKQHLEAFMTSETYTFLGRTCLGGRSTTSYWAGSDLLRGYAHAISGSLFYEFGWRKNQNYPASGATGFMLVSQLVPRDATSARWYQVRIAWSATFRSNTHWGPWGCDGLSEDSILAAAIQVLEYFGLPNLLSNPVEYGNVNRYSAGPFAYTNLEVKKYGDNIIRTTTESKPHIQWKYDTPTSNTLYDWFCCREGFIPGRIRNAASLALANTMASLPEVSANSVANVLELASGLSGIRGLVRNGTSKMLQLAKRIKDPRNAWLSWRYVYNTTKMDLEDYQNVTRRLVNIAGAPTFKVHGFGDGGYFTIRCVKQFRSSDFNVLDYDTRRLLRTYGFKLSAYNAWDMVPFSFMVDWFTQIGPKLELAENWNKHYEFTPEDTWYSYRENFSHGFCYFRWHGTDPSIPPTYVKRETSKRTFFYRLADTVSIFT